MGNVRIYENSLIIQKYFCTPLKRGKKFSYPMKMLQNIWYPPLFHSAPVPSIKNDQSLRALVMLGKQIMIDQPPPVKIYVPHLMFRKNHKPIYMVLKRSGGRGVKTMNLLLEK